MCSRFRFNHPTRLGVFAMSLFPLLHLWDRPRFRSAEHGRSHFPFGFTTRPSIAFVVFPFIGPHIILQPVLLRSMIFFADINLPPCNPTNPFSTFVARRTFSLGSVHAHASHFQCPSLSAIYTHTIFDYSNSRLVTPWHRCDVPPGTCVRWKKNPNAIYPNSISI